MAFVEKILPQGQLVSQNDLGIDSVSGKLMQGFPLVKDTITPLNSFDRYYTGEGQFGIGDYHKTGTFRGLNLFKYSRTAGLFNVKTVVGATPIGTMSSSSFFWDITNATNQTASYITNNVSNLTITLDKGVLVEQGGIRHFRTISQIIQSAVGTGMSKYKDLMDISSSISIGAGVQLWRGQNLYLTLDKHSTATIDEHMFIYTYSSNMANIADIPKLWIIKNSIPNAHLFSQGKILLGNEVDLNEAKLQITGNFFLTANINLNNKSIINANSTVPTAGAAGQPQELRIVNNQIYFYNGAWNKVNLTAI